MLTDHECAGFAAMGGLRVPGVGNAGSLAYLNGLPSDAAVTAPGSTPARQSMVGTYEGAGNPVYTILGDGYPQNYDIDGKVLVGFGGGGTRYETWLTRPLPGGNGLSSIPNQVDSRPGPG
jgi:alkaline phosphatase